MPSLILAEEQEQEEHPLGLLHKHVSWRMILSKVGICMTTHRQDRSRSFFASVCLFAVVMLHAPLAGTFWSSRGAACCTSDHCPIPAHHHRKAPAAPANHMDCGHDMPGMTACALSCCQNPDRPAITPVVFLLPASLNISELATVESAINLSKPLDFSRSIEPLSPPPRFTVAAA